MKLVIDQGWDHLIGPWMEERTQGTHSRERGPFISLIDDQRGILAACQFTDCNGASIVLHCVGDGKNWLNREYLWFVFFYPFEQLGVKKIICPVESSNLQSIRFIEHIGFTLEATLKDASPKGDLLLYTLSRENCKWLSLRNLYRGQAFGSSNS